MAEHMSLRSTAPLCTVDLQLPEAAPVGIRGIDTAAYYDTYGFASKKRADPERWCEDEEQQPVLRRAALARIL